MAELRRIRTVSRHLCSAPTAVPTPTPSDALPEIIGGDQRVFETVSACLDRTVGRDLHKLLPGPLDDERIRKVSR